MPFRDNGYLTEAQRKFNATHSSAHSIVERAFGRLKGKFRRLKGTDATCTRNALQMIEGDDTEIRSTIPTNAVRQSVTHTPEMVRP